MSARSAGLMIDPQDALDAALEDANCGFLLTRLSCDDCGYSSPGYVPFAIETDTKLECPRCKSINTERE